MKLAAIERRILQGARLHTGFGPDGQTWWLDAPYARVGPHQAKDLIGRGRTDGLGAVGGSNGGVILIEAGDSLFGWRGNSQTWLSVYDD